MRRVVLAAVVVVLVLLPTPVRAGGADVVGGHASSNELDIAFTSGASDATPGVGLDGRGHVRVQFRDADMDGRVLCVNAVGRNARVIAEVTKVREGEGILFEGGTSFIVVAVTDNGSLPDLMRPSIVSLFPPLTEQGMLTFVQTNCIPLAGDILAPQGNVTVKDGA